MFVIGRINPGIVQTRFNHDKKMLRGGAHADRGQPRFTLTDELYSDWRTWSLAERSIEIGIFDYGCWVFFIWLFFIPVKELDKKAVDIQVHNKRKKEIHEHL